MARHCMFDVRYRLNLLGLRLGRRLRPWPVDGRSLMRNLM